jgi:hypothetical protein
MDRSRGALREGLATAAIADRQCLHIFLEVEVEELEDEVELVGVGVEDVEEADDVGVFHFLEEGDLANGRTWNALVFRLEADLLECDNTTPIK